jgi:hypothetical protein
MYFNSLLNFEELFMRIPYILNNYVYGDSGLNHHSLGDMAASRGFSTKK